MSHLRNDGFGGYYDSNGNSYHSDGVGGYYDNNGNSYHSDGFGGFWKNQNLIVLLCMNSMVFMERGEK